MRLPCDCSDRPFLTPFATELASLNPASPPQKKMPAPTPKPTPAPSRHSRRLLTALAGLAALTLGAGLARAQIPAFPGAQGFGAYATGGRGGDVYYVTNLNSSGAGSLNHGIQNAPTSGRTIVFAVSGYIPIANNSDTGNKTLRLVQNKITIAGQTAPGDGIGLKDGRVLLTGNNQVLRHLRIRHGKYGSAGDCLNLDSSATNSIIDHVSLMFSTDENISFFNSALDNFTMQYSTSAWGMERHNAGGLWDLVDGTCHHSLWAHHRTRNPKARPYGLLEWINNVTFHWRTEGFIMGDSQSNVSWRANVRGNYFLSIPDHQFGVDNTALSKARIASNGQPNFALFLDNCLHDSNNNGLLDGTDKGYSIVAGLPYPNAGTTPGTVSYAQSATPFAGASGTATVVIDPPLTAYKKVLSNAGPLRLDATYAGNLRDELDSLLISSVENQQSILVAKDSPLDANDTPSSGEALLAQPPYNISNNGFGTLNSATAPADGDGDGMPDYWESALGWNASSQDHNTALASSGGYVSGLTFMPANTPAGYTRLEEYLHFKAIPHAAIDRNISGTPSSLTVDLRRYVRGFVKAPVTFTLNNVSNGSASLQGNGYTAVFTPTQNYAGRARFDFTVTDGDGSTWTQTLGVLVKTTPPAGGGGGGGTIQAESGTITGGTFDSNNAGFNGTGFANLGVSGGVLQLNNIDGGSGGSATLTIRFALGASTSRTGNLVINGASQAITFAPTGSWTTWTTLNVPISLNSGSSNTLRFESTGQDLANIDEITIAASSPPAAPQDVVAQPYSQQVVLGWSPVSGATAYAVKRSTTSGGSYTTVGTPTTTSYVNTGLTNGTTYYYVVSASNSSGAGPNSAQVSATPTGIPAATLQVESSGYGGGVTIDSNNTGFNGTGFANFPMTGGYAQFSGIGGGPSGGSTTLIIRYALGATGSRTGTLTVNGASQSITFAPTGSWTTWTTMSVPITLAAGTGNTIRFDSTGQDLANLDQIAITAN